MGGARHDKVEKKTQGKGQTGRKQIAAVLLH